MKTYKIIIEEYEDKISFPDEMPDEEIYKIMNEKLFNLTQEFAYYVDWTGYDEED